MVKAVLLPHSKQYTCIESINNLKKHKPNNNKIKNSKSFPWLKAKI